MSRKELKKRRARRATQCAPISTRVPSTRIANLLRGDHLEQELAPTSARGTYPISSSAINWLEQARPEATAQRNFTDPESRIMTDRGRKGSFVQAYNAQIALDSAGKSLWPPRSLRRVTTSSNWRQCRSGWHKIWEPGRWPRRQFVIAGQVRSGPPGERVIG
jgi:hypothetical protein